MPQEIVVPELGESILEATVARWLKEEGDRVAVGEAVVELETDKVDLEVGAEQDGRLARIQAQEGEDVEVGDVLGLIEDVEEAEAAPEEPDEEEGAEEEAEAEPVPEEEMEAAPEATDGQEPAPEEREVTPVARRLADEHEVDLAQVSGSGMRGRVTKEDVQRYLKEAPAERPPEKAPTPADPSPDGAEREAPAEPRPAAEREERVRMSRRRRTIARRLVEAQQTAAMLTTFNDVDMTPVMDLRRRHKEDFREQHDVGLGIVSFFVKASIGALKEFPRLNAEIDGDEIVLKRHYDIGVAIGAEDGLVVPVLRDADRMSFAEIERAIKGFAQKAEDHTLTLEDLRGGTFTITNGGVFGSLLSTPILNPPQVAILGLHRIEERPVVVDGQLLIRSMMYLAVSYDHRIVDGREAVQFLARIKALIEDPERLLLEG